ncbi:type Iii polyketide Synthase [Mycena pura]|uniref:Type Iii polyketide Synthase n=1 Tax=Mycena pura TaxID=153505 RepID=A0AAD7E1R3_9AGAR|nr:type Iii polyketide Synthase [Mycena pura]
MINISGLGVSYPPALVSNEEFAKMAYSLYKPSAALDKVFAISTKTGIKTRSQVVTGDHPLFTQPAVPSITQISQLFTREGVKLAVRAARDALADAGLKPEDVTHLVATTCTSSSNPGYDFHVARALGLPSAVERVLLHGVGCAGGLAAVRLASRLCKSAEAGSRPVHVLVVACEVNSAFARNELECIDRDNEVRIGTVLFGDGAGAVVVSRSDDGDSAHPDRGAFEIVHCAHTIVPDTADIISLDVCPEGWKETISPRLPSVVGQCIPTIYKNLLASLPPALAAQMPESPRDLDWPIHTGGAAFLRAAAQALALDQEHLRASWAVYADHGNTSSSSVLAVLDDSRRTQTREWAVSLAFGPGLVAEVVLLRRLDFQRATSRCAD